MYLYFYVCMIAKKKEICHRAMHSMFDLTDLYEIDRKKKRSN